MKNIFSIFLVLTFIVSCSKKDAVPPPVDPVVPVLPDTLGTGWSKTALTPTGNIEDIYFVNNSTGYTTGANGIFKSTDGGSTWNIIDARTSYYNIGGFGSNVCFVNKTNIPITSQDNGVSFQSNAYTSSNTSTNFGDCFFSSQNICYLTTPTSVWKSTNAGANFSRVSVSTIVNSGSSTNSVFFTNDNKGWLVTSNGGVYKTQNGGIDWNLNATLDFITSSFASIDFVNENVGFVGVKGNFYKTIDGGVTWSSAINVVPQINNASSYTDVDFINTNLGYLCNYGLIYKTINGGATWSKVVSLGTGAIVEIHFNDATHGWSCTTDSKVLRFLQ